MHGSVYRIKKSETMRAIYWLVVHCSATRADAEYMPEQLERDHKARGFLRAGYNLYVRKSGEVVEMRPLEMVPAHVKGHNRNSVGICYEGGLDAAGRPADTRTLRQKEALLGVLERLKKRFPKARICGHRDLSPDLDGDGVIEPREWIKACPSFDAQKEYKDVGR